MIRLAFSSDPRSDQRPRSGAAGHGAAGHRPSRAGVRGAHARAARRAAHDLQDIGPGGDLSELRFRRLGSGAGQHAVAGRPRAGVRDRPFLGQLEDRSPSGSACASTTCRATGAAARRTSSSRRGWPPTRRTRSKPSSSSTTRRPRVWPAGSPDLRRAMNRAGHPALLIVDAVSSLASFDYRHDEWGVDVTVCGSQKGLMVPPGIGFVAVSEKARRGGQNRDAAAGLLGLGRDHQAERGGLFPVHAPHESFLWPARSAADAGGRGAANIFRRHERHAEATRAAVRAWGLEIVCEDPREYSSSMTAIFMPEGHNADRLREIILERYNMSLGVGLVEALRPGVPHRPSRQLQRSDADGHAGRRRDGTPRWRACLTARAASWPRSNRSLRPTLSVEPAQVR